MTKWAEGMSQQISADAVGISVGSAQRIDRCNSSAVGIGLPELIPSPLCGTAC